MIRPVVASVSQHTKTTTSHDGIGSDQDSMMHIIHIDTTHTTVERHPRPSQKGSSSIIDNHKIVLVLLGVAAILVAIGATTSSIFVVTDTTAAAVVASHRTVRRNNENKLPTSQQQQQRRQLHAQTQDQHPRTLSTHNQHQFETATVHSLGSSGDGSGSRSSAPSKTKMKVEPNEHIADQQDKKSKSVNDENNIKEERAGADYPTKYDYQTTYHYTNPQKVATLRDDPTKKKKTKKDYEVFDPQIAWLASFPNSGTSFTLTLVARATNTTFATNYGLEATYGRRDTPSLPIYARHPEGPFMPDPVTSFHHRDLPYGRHVITKTHCGGSCVNCGPTTYAYGYNTDTDNESSTSNTNTITTTTNNNNNNTESNDSDNASLPSPPLQFLQDCASGHAIDGHGNMIDVSYPPERVSRVIHMIRNPFHNAIVSFFFLFFLSFFVISRCIAFE